MSDSERVPVISWKWRYIDSMEEEKGWRFREGISPIKSVIRNFISLHTWYLFPDLKQWYCRLKRCSYLPFVRLNTSSTDAGEKRA